MIDNIHARSELLGFSRRQSRDKVRKSVRKSQLDEALANGWEIQRKNKHSFSMTKPKSKPDLLESRVWTLMYRMGFEYLSGDGGAFLAVTGRGEDGPKTQIDVVAVDEEVALAIECKTVERPRKDSSFAEKLAKHASTRGRFANAIAKALPAEGKRHVASVMFVWDFKLSENDRLRADEEKVTLFDERDLQYFEALTKHLGRAARYQLLAELFRGRQVKGLELKVPALRTRLGGLNCYTFAIRPEYLLKIAYVAHRAKGKAIDLDSYQRMISKSRLKKIAEYISGDGVFPTNIVVNVEDARYMRFDRGKQEGSPDAGLFGLLTLSPSYGSAWIIDGQHRLFAYSGHPRSETSYLNVLAFEGLPPTRQTQLFVDINSEQRRVKRSLLVELDATLKWDSASEDKRVHAIISKVGMALDDDPASPLHNRVLLADVRRTHLRCVSLTSIASALSKPGFFIKSKKKGITDYGPLWRDEPSDCLRRSVKVLTGWFSEIADAADDWWNVGSDDGGGLAMNDGVTVCLNVLRSVFEQTGSSLNLAMLDDKELTDKVIPFARSLGDYFARMSTEERLVFRRFRGVEGQTNGTRMCQEALQVEFPEFDPPGLDDWKERRKKNTNNQARVILDRMETVLQMNVLGSLKEEFSESPDQWWFEGVPLAVRKKVDLRINEAGGGEREKNFDLVHYRDIIQGQWALFKDTYGYGEGRVGKERGTGWIREIGDMRNKVAHRSRQDYLSFEEINALEDYEAWLNRRIAEQSD